MHRVLGHCSYETVLINSRAVWEAKVYRCMTAVTNKAVSPWMQSSTGVVSMHRVLGHCSYEAVSMHRVLGHCSYETVLINSRAVWVQNAVGISLLQQTKLFHLGCRAALV